jgi:hypothetical protein
MFGTIRVLKIRQICHLGPDERRTGTQPEPAWSLDMTRQQDDNTLNCCSNVAIAAAAGALEPVTIIIAALT